MKLSRRGFLKTFAISIYAIKSKNLFAQGMSFNKKNNNLKLSKKAISNIDNITVAYSKDLINWDGVTYPYVDYINQEVVNELVNQGIMQLTNQQDIKTAWRSLINYKKNEVILIKPNFNWIGTKFKKIVTSPQVINSVIRSLTEYVGVKEKNIYVYDVSRPIPKCYRERINYDVKYVHRAVTIYERGWRKIFGDLTCPSDIEINLSYPVKDKYGKSLRCYLPKVVAMGDHLINIPILKAHPFLLFSGALKNHFGSIVFSNKDTSPRFLHGKHIHDFIVDININSHLRKCTRLVICDAITGTWSDENLGTPEKWKSFGEDYPSSLFFSSDPIKMDLYLRNLVQKERQLRKLKIKPDTFIKKFEV